MHEQLRDRVLAGWAALVSRRPRTVLVVAAGFVAAAILTTLVGVGWGEARLGPLTFQADRNDLISHDLDWNQRFIDWQLTFGGRDQVAVIIDLGLTSDAADYGARRVAGEAVADRLGAWLRDARLLGPDGAPRSVAESVFWRFDADAVDPRAIRLLDGDDFESAFEQVQQGIDAAKSILTSDGVVDFLGRLQAAMAVTEPGAGGAARRASNTATDSDPAHAAPFTALAHRIGELANFVEAVARFPGEAEIDPFTVLERLSRQAAQQPVYLVSDNGRLLFLRCRPAMDASRLSASAWALDQLHHKIETLAAAHPELSIGVTGIMALEAEETQAATRDSAIASIIAVVCIVALLVTAFHSWRTPLLAMIALLVGVAWTFGFATVAVGHLQVVSVVFTVILLGLGIAYGIHLAARFELVRHVYPDSDEGFEAAMRDSLRTVGPGVVTGALTTAAAFATTLLTDFNGVAEMGLIAAGGVVLCLVSMGAVFPAMLRLVKPGVRHIRAMDRRVLHLFEERWVMPAVRWPGRVLVAAGVLTVLAVLPIVTGHMPFDDDLMALLPEKSQAVRWQTRIARDGGKSIHFGISVCASLAEARERVDRFRQLQAVRSVGGVGMLFPVDDQDKARRLDSVRQELDMLVAAPVEQEAVTGRPAGQESDDITWVFAGMRGQIAMAKRMRALPPALATPIQHLDGALRSAIANWGALTDADRAAALARLNGRYTVFRENVIASLRAVTARGPLDADVLPATLRGTYVAPDGRCVLEIDPALPPGVDSPLEAGFLSRFVEDLQRVDPLVTGPAVQIYESGLLIKRSYKIAGVLALGAVLALVFLDFGRLGDALLSLLPVGVGFALTFGLMWLCGMRVNAANIIVLPLMFGIGVDAGVHMLHRYRAEPTAQPLGLTHGTGKGITVTSLTAVIGFGSLLVAEHRGIASLGFVMASGILLTMFACWWVLPAWLTLRRPRA